MIKKLFGKIIKKKDKTEAQLLDETLRRMGLTTDDIDRARGDTSDFIYDKADDTKMEGSILKSKIVLPSNGVFSDIIELMIVLASCLSRETRQNAKGELKEKMKKINEQNIQTLIREIFKKNDDVHIYLESEMKLKPNDCKNNPIEIITRSQKNGFKYVYGQTNFSKNDIYLENNLLILPFTLDFGASCVHEKSMVTMADETKKMAKNIQKGDEVKTNHGKSKVKCILKTKLINSFGNFVKLDSGLLITPWHPVKINGNWGFPIHNSSKFVQKECQAVYSFLLENDHVLLIDNTEVCGLAHNFKGGVIEHDYYGTDKVVKDLEKMKGYNQGLVEVQQGNCIIRDSTTGNVSGLYQSKQTKNSLYL